MFESMQISSGNIEANQTHPKNEPLVVVDEEITPQRLAKSVIRTALMEKELIKTS